MGVHDVGRTVVHGLWGSLEVKQRTWLESPGSGGSIVVHRGVVWSNPCRNGSVVKCASGCMAERTPQ